MTRAIVGCKQNSPNNLDGVRGRGRGWSQNVPKYLIYYVVYVTPVTRRGNLKFAENCVGAQDISYEFNFGSFPFVPPSLKGAFYLHPRRTCHIFT